MQKRKQYEKGSFGEKLDSLIAKADFSKNSFCSAIKISKSYLFDMLNGRSLPSDEMQEKIAETLKLSPQQRINFFNFIAVRKNDLPSDIIRLLKENPDKYDEVRQLLVGKNKLNQSGRKG